MIDISGAASTAHPNGVQLIAVAVAISCWDVGATALVNQSGAIANSTAVKGAYTVVYIVANVVTVNIFRARASAHPHSIQCVAIAVALPCWDVSATAFIHCPRSIAHVASIVIADARVFIITDAIIVIVFCAVSPALKDRIQGGATAVVLGGVDVVVAGVGVCTTLNFCIVADTVAVLIRGTVAVAHPDGIIRADTGVDVVTDVVGVFVGLTGAVADS